MAVAAWIGICAAGACALPAFAAQPAASDGDWPMAGNDYANRRYSPLEQIDVSNARGLKLAFTFDTGITQGHEGAPVVAEGLMYIVTPYPNKVFALDLAQPGVPVKWQFAPSVDPAAQGQACCDGVNHGAAYAEGRIFFNTLDGQTFALDARSGRELWRVKVADSANGETMTMAPLIVKGSVIVGNSGSENGARGWLAALDSATGKLKWRAYSTGPDRDVAIGASFKPFYEQDRGKDLGVSSWPLEGWKLGGGTVGGFISYDPALDLIYYGTSSPAPWNPQQRPGDNKWTAGVFARDADSGAARWFYQFAPHDLHAYGGGNENVLVDIEVGGAVRKALLHPGRNGYVYAIDRASGEVLSAEPYAYITTSIGVDIASGRIHYSAQTEPRVGKVVRNICPASAGAKNWQPSAYSPRTRLLYLPHQNLCQEAEVSQASYIAGTPYLGSQIKMHRGPGLHRGALTAWDPAAAKPAWNIDEDFPIWSGALVTAGDVLFYGTLDGIFKAVDAKTGTLLWAFDTGSGIVGQPIAYRGPDGKEYIAILSGVGGWAGSVVSRDLDTRDATAAMGLASVVADLKHRTRKGGKLYVFALP